MAATWPRLKYEREREHLAKKLIIRVGQLDKLVAAARTSEASGTALPFAEVEPSSEPVDGADLLADLTVIIRRFVVLDPDLATLCALWIVLTYLVDRATVLPILAVSSPEKGCGKTTLLALVGRLAQRPILASNISPAALFRAVEKWAPTLLIDEADSFLRDNDEMRGLLNSGHTRDSAYVIRTVGDDFEPRQFSTWGAKVIAMIGRLADTLEARSVNITMRRKAAGERATNLRHADRAPFEQLRSRIARWAADNGEAFEAARPVLPESLENRAGDNAEPLLAIADLAGGRWPAEARHAILQLIGAATESSSVGEELLSAIKIAFEGTVHDRLGTTELLRSLNGDAEARWATYARGKEMTPRQLARRLAAFGIKPGMYRIDRSPVRGYERSQFTDAFARYLPTPDVTTQQAPPGEARGVTADDAVTVTGVTPEAPVTGCYVTEEDAVTPPASPDEPGNGVTHPTPRLGEGMCDADAYRRASRGG